MGRHRIRLSMLVLVSGIAAACTGAGGDSTVTESQAEGPAEVELEAVEEHARQFDDELAEREAGSQQEFAAATYITAHLQQSGYQVALRSVPYKDLVRSTNVVALPPSDDDPAAVVTVAYDTTTTAPPLGRDIGLFLELARAAKVADPDHDVQFVALAAELTDANGGNLGSRALAAELADLDEPPPVVALMDVTGGGFRAPGPGGDDLNQIAADLDIPHARPLSEAVLPAHLRATTVLTEAGIDHAIAAGGVEEIGRVVLEFLSDTGR